MISAPLVLTEPPLVPTLQPVKVTVPKLANGTREPFCSKSSTIHSALVSQSCAVWPLNECDTDRPVDRFSILTLPADVDVAVAVMRTESPARMVKPEKV